MPCFHVTSISCAVRLENGAYWVLHQMLKRGTLPGTARDRGCGNEEMGSERKSNEGESSPQRMQNNRCFLFRSKEGGHHDEETDQRSEPSCLRND